MYRKLILTALCCFAFTAPAFAAGQHPADNARDHPASNAHANAVAGQADAARIEACGHAASTFLDQLAKGDYKAATANFDATMREGLSADKLGEVWQSIGAQFGKLVSRGTAQSVMYQDTPVVSTPLKFEKGSLVAQLVCGKDGKFAGFHIQPLPSAPASASTSP